MSALWPHIRALRAEAKALEHAATMADEREKLLLAALASAKETAAAELEACMREMIERVASQPAKEG